MKQKTHSGTKKRFKQTGSGKLMMSKACKNHLLSSKSKRQKKYGQQGIEVPSSRKKTIARLLNISQ
ncbi:50S ribosomal protein L35 [Candidatus Gracilibacteria bacterium]|nr:50S ribosomal protein L35 [Candidatus Gracilibacteria bacterium]MCF7819236.1 50S ribosomal protein L35 [Candidatus Gracilibacteria bacterium]